MITSVLKKYSFFIATVSIISALSGLVNVWLLKLINDYISGDGTKSEYALATYSCVLILMIGSSYASQYLLSRLSVQTFYSVRKKFVERISELSYRSLELIGNHRLYTAITHDINELNGLIRKIPSYVYNGTVVAACLVYMSTISLVYLAIVLGSLLSTMLVALLYIHARASHYFMEAREVQDDLFKCYQSIIDGNKELRFNSKRRELFFEQDLDEAAIKYRDKSLHAYHYWSLSNSWFRGMLFLAIGIIVFSSETLALVNSEIILTFILTLLYMTGPFFNLINIFQDVSRVKVVLKKLHELQLTVESQGLVENQKQANFGSFQCLEIKGIEFQYPITEKDSRSFTVGPISFDLNRGDVIYLVGGNGSGKTTAAKLITGLYQSKKGNVFLNGIKILPENIESYQNLFSVILPDYWLFEKALKKGGGIASEKTIDDLRIKLRLPNELKLSGQNMPTGNLSQGQKKRLALLLAYIEDSEIYVFDEWAAEQDPEFKDFFYESFLAELKKRKKAVIVITHDDRYFHLADKVFKFSQGNIEEVV